MRDPLSMKTKKKHINNCHRIISPCYSPSYTHRRRQRDKCLNKLNTLIIIIFISKLKKNHCNVVKKFLFSYYQYPIVFMSLKDIY